MIEHEFVLIAKDGIVFLSYFSFDKFSLIPNIYIIQLSLIPHVSSWEFQHGLYLVRQRDF